MARLSTGRFTTRLELVEKVVYLYKHTSCSMDQIAKNCKISSATVSNILKRNIKLKGII